MKKTVRASLLVIATFGCCAVNIFADNQDAVSAAAAPIVRVKVRIDFGDNRSETLVGKAWTALAQNDFDSVLAYTNKCISFYAKKASKMQAGLKDYVSGSTQDKFQYWALNDVATAYFIQGEAYRTVKMNDKAKEAYSKIISDYSFGQCWDLKGWFWKPAEAAQEDLDMMAAGGNWKFGDYTSSTLTTRAWEALAAHDLKAVLAYTNKCISLYGKEAGEMQASLKDYVTGSNAKIFQYWALNDVATAYFIQAEAYRAANMKDKAKEAYNKIIKDYSFGQCWVTKGWFWKPAEAAKEDVEMMSTGLNWDFGDYSSSALTTRAWEALAAHDLKAVLTYTNKCISLYSVQADKMQAELKDYATGSNAQIFKFWALNDVTTAYFIQAEAYRDAKMNDKAKEAYNKIINDYPFGQCWDPGISKFSASDFKNSMSPEVLIEVIQTKSGIEVPAAETPVKSLNKLLEEDHLYKFMANIPDEVRDSIGRLEQGKKLSPSETEWLNRTLVEENYPLETPERKGWFWKPADGAKAILDMMAAGINWGSGAFTSSVLSQKAWSALEADDLKSVEVYVNETLKLYAGKAKNMQASLQGYASGDDDKIFSYWALNDVGTALFILGEAYQNDGKKDDAIKAYKRVVNEFFYAQCWDPKGWFWKPAEGAQQRLGDLENTNPA